MPHPSYPPALGSHFLRIFNPWPKVWSSPVCFVPWSCYVTYPFPSLHPDNLQLPTMLRFQCRDVFTFWQICWCNGTHCTHFWVCVGLCVRSSCVMYLSWCWSCLAVERILSCWQWEGRTPLPVGRLRVCSRTEELLFLQKQNSPLIFWFG